MPHHGFLSGKKALIIGMASNRSIAYGVAQAMHAQGATLAFTFQNERLSARVTKLAQTFNSTLLFPCDVSDDLAIDALMDSVKQHWDNIDILIHSVAFAPSDQLEGHFLKNITRDGFKMAHDISSYSLAALAKAAHQKNLLQSGSAITAMTYLGATRAMPSYNTMGLAKASLEANVRYLALCLGPEGIRVNAVSAGPIRTLAASGIKGFKNMLDYNAKVTPLKQNVTTEQVGNATAFLSSDLASGITGEIMHVDAGFNMVGMADLSEQPQ
ncbi:MAG: enoyl-[acyl-carrier-protein] reductase FabI [Legionellales bacterium]|nr:enoyl-[acyl-carrier-protein] reductase FabI [Legionellales bacterium]